MNYRLRIHVRRCDSVSFEDIASLKPDYILISPGPRDPAHAGISVPLIRRYYKDIPILGVCLGMQCINEAFSGVTERSRHPVHGKTSTIRHSSKGIFRDIPSPFVAARYHSLRACFDKSVLEVTAHSDDGIIMGLSHPMYPVHGVQFHPESFMTEHGFLLVENFLRLGSLKV